MYGVVCPSAHPDAMVWIQFKNIWLKTSSWSFFKIIDVSSDKRKLWSWVKFIRWTFFFCYVFNILKQEKYTTLRSFLFMPYSRHSYHTRSCNNMFAPYTGFEIIRMKFQYLFIKEWLEITESIKHQRLYPMFKNVFHGFFLSQNPASRCFIFIFYQKNKNPVRCVDFFLFYFFVSTCI